MSGYFLILPAFTAGWYAHWYFKLRPFAREVEKNAREIQEILHDAEVREEATK